MIAKRGVITTILFMGMVFGIGTAPQSLFAETESPETKKEWGRSPFSETDYSQEELANTPSTYDYLRLKGLLIRGGDRVVIINNSILRQGDVIQGKKVVKIDEGSVLLEDEKEQLKLGLGGTQEVTPL